MGRIIADFKTKLADLLDACHLEYINNINTKEVNND
jgi:hypothetical protein